MEKQTVQTSRKLQELQELQESRQIVSINDVQISEIFSPSLSPQKPNRLPYKYYLQNLILQTAILV